MPQIAPEDIIFFNLTTIVEAEWITRITLQTNEHPFSSLFFQDNLSKPMLERKSYCEF